MENQGSDNALPQDNAPKTDATALFRELFASMSAGERLALIVEQQKLESEETARKVAERTKRIAERMVTVNEVLAGLNPLIAEFNKAEGTQLHITFAVEDGGYILRDAPPIASKRVRRSTANTPSAIGLNSITAGQRGKRVACRLDNAPYGQGAVGTVYGSMADCARAAGLSDEKIYEHGGGHAGRAMDAVGIRYTLID